MSRHEQSLRELNLTRAANSQRFYTQLLSSTKLECISNDPKFLVKRLPLHPSRSAQPS
jgi:hypothetical protein